MTVEATLRFLYGPDYPEVQSLLTESKKRFPDVELEMIEEEGKWPEVIVRDPRTTTITALHEQVALCSYLLGPNVCLSSEGRTDAGIAGVVNLDFEAPVSIES